MVWGRLPRYCCTNITGRCVYSLSDALFSQKQFEAWAGLCKGSDNRPGCGKPLELGKPDDRRFRLIASGMLTALALGSGAVALRTYIFPPPLVDISFASGQSRVDDSAGHVVLEIRRISGQNSRAELMASFVDGTAKAGFDYEIPGQVVVLQPGQTEVQISIPVLPDNTLRKGERHFSVVLDNVLGQPRHSVIIAPKPKDITAQIQIEQMVLTASRIGADIAGLMVKYETMDKLLSDLQGREEEFREFRLQMRDAANNLVRAREAYLQAVRSLQTQPTQQVLDTIERLQTDLRQRNFIQQAQVLPILGRHYRELVDGKSADMDRWVIELGQTIERVPSDNRIKSTV
jgi:hypothetical protein